MKYRSDIDGLRALAVLSVIVFHISEALLPGGFVGVDIFFVLSGYLITLHIVSEIDARRFSLAEFYRRRIKRIAPAMLVVLGVTFVLAQFLMLPEDAERVAESSLWSLLSLANVYFWLFQDTSYFAASSSELPLLHLWSLGVEEQFYVFWPLILMVAYSATRRVGFGIAAATVAVASFAFGQWYFTADPSFVYYMLPTRAGELMTGALLAHYVNAAGDEGPPAWVANLAAVTGLVLVLGSLVWVSQTRVFPGFQAVPPTLGTALLLLAGQYGQSPITRFFQLKPLVWIGLISYSAYLIHWPILAFLRYGGVPITLLVGVAVLVATLALAWLNYRYVEQPLRRTRRSLWQVFVLQFAVPVGVLGVLALAARKLDGYGVRPYMGDYAASLDAVRMSMQAPYANPNICQSPVVTPDDLNNEQCVLGARVDGQPVRALLVGDSIAAQYVGMLGQFADASGFSFRNVAASACPLIYADPAPFVTARRVSDCRESLSVLRPVLDDYDVLIIGSAWAYYHSESQTFYPTFFESVETWLASGKKLILLGKPTLIPGYDRRCRQKALSMPFVNCDLSDVPMDPDVKRGNERIRDFAASTAGVSFYNPNEYLCPNDQCRVADDQGEPLFFDYGHLSVPGSEWLGQRILERDGVPAVFDALGNPRQ